MINISASTSIWIWYTMQTTAQSCWCWYFGLFSPLTPLLLIPVYIYCSHAIAEHETNIRHQHNWVCKFVWECQLSVCRPTSLQSDWMVLQWTKRIPLVVSSSQLHKPESCRVSSARHLRGLSEQQISQININYLHFTTESPPNPKDLPPSDQDSIETASRVRVRAHSSILKEHMMDYNLIFQTQLSDSQWGFIESWHSFQFGPVCLSPPICPSYRQCLSVGRQRLLFPTCWIK